MGHPLVWHPARDSGTRCPVRFGGKQGPNARAAGDAREPQETERAVALGGQWSHFDTRHVEDDGSAALAGLPGPTDRARRDRVGTADCPTLLHLQPAKESKAAAACRKHPLGIHFLVRCRSRGTQRDANLAYSTITQSLLLRPKTSGEYISSTLAGGTTNVPGVVARATYEYW
jgi:hypothetical protein